MHWPVWIIISTTTWQRPTLGKPEQRDLILSYNDVNVLNIKRDMRDVVVSAYYHECCNSGYEGSFQDFYWQRGRTVAQRVADYHEVWSVESSRVHTAYLVF
jgi:hypothetical protein